METGQHEQIIRDRERRSRRIQVVILCCLVMIPLFWHLEGKVMRLGQVSFPVSGNLLIFVLLNINILLLLLVIFLVLRNLVQLVFERRRKFLGTRLKTKLVISFVAMSLIPTGLLFFTSIQFVSTSMDYWFNSNVAQSLDESLRIAKGVYQEAELQVARQGAYLASRLGERPHHSATPGSTELLSLEMLESHHLTGLEILANGQRQVSLWREPLAGGVIPDLPPELFGKVLAGTGQETIIQPVPEGELVRGLTVFKGTGAEPSGVLVLSLLIPVERLRQMHTVSAGYEGYQQLMQLKKPIKTSLLFMLLIVTLLIVFCAIWFGFYVSAGLTGPIGKLAEATRRVAEGELDFVLEKTSGDEMGTLVDSFNLMTSDLAASKRQLTEANEALRQSTQEAEARRRSMEIILQNVAAGVISLDETGRITTINRFAEQLLHIDRVALEGRHYRAILRQEHMAMLDSFLGELYRSGKGTIERPLRLTIGEETYSLRVSFTRLADEQGQASGVVLVFDNLTELEKAQRMAAWREVARRIAHEVKNPLTPIQLSAQRLRKRYLDRLGEDTEVFDVCTRTIIDQVEELKKLVGEFSSFARMPVLQKSMADLSAMVGDVFGLYREAHKDRVFELRQEGEMPSFPFDRTQIKRVLINLLDNAVAATKAGNTIEVILTSDLARRVACLEVRDNGPGISDRDKPRLFEPYFSTKQGGTGLGLAIASTVVADHQGTIRVRDNEPHGVRFQVELPMGDG
ncbi:MAG: sensor histidine kinase [Thermodesulfobacteriota bacterium]